MDFISDAVLKSLEPREKETYIINGHIFNSDNSSNFANRYLPIIENISIKLREKGAFPVLEFSTDNLINTFLQAFQKGEIDAVSPYFFERLKHIAGFIDFDLEIPFYQPTNINEEKYKQYFELYNSYYEKINKYNLKSVVLNLPEFLFEYKEDLPLRQDYVNQYTDALDYLLGLDSDLLDELSVMAEKVAKISLNSLNVQQDIPVENGELCSIYSKDKRIVNFPCFFFECKFSNFTDILTFEKIKINDKFLKDVRFTFEKGILRSVKSKDDELALYSIFKNALNSPDYVFKINIGLNKMQKFNTGDKFFDINRFKNCSLLIARDSEFEQKQLKKAIFCEIYEQYISLQNSGLFGLIENSKKKE